MPQMKKSGLIVQLDQQGLNYLGKGAIKWYIMFGSAQLSHGASSSPFLYPNIKINNKKEGLFLCKLMRKVSIRDLEASGGRRTGSQKIQFKADRHPLVDGPGIGSDPARGTGCRSYMWDNCPHPSGVHQEDIRKQMVRPHCLTSEGYCSSRIRDEHWMWPKLASKSL